MPQKIPADLHLIQVTIWDILGEIPIEMRKPIDLLFASHTAKRRTKKKTKLVTENQILL
jgi:hypothetical protein